MSLLPILMVEDDKDFERLVRNLLLRWRSSDQFRLYVANSLTEARKLIAQIDFHLMFLDLALRGERETGFRLLEEIRKQGSKMEVVVMSSTSSFESVQKAMRLGANDYLRKGFTQEEFLYSLEQAQERSRWKGMELRLREASTRDMDRYQLIGKSPSMRSLRESIEKLAPTQVPILIEAETGSGKELVARNLHLRGRDPTAPFVALDCGAIPETMAESILFGHERGAFTGANEQSVGVFEQANGGTLFLDEITNLSLDMQNKLLRALQEREIRRVGGKKIISVDFRLISAANQSIEKLVEIKKFKQDLFFRINVIQISLPPLRDRLDDLPDLIHGFLGRKKISPDLLTVLMSYSWPGNIRELKNLITACIALSGDKPSIDLMDLPETALNRIMSSNESSPRANTDMATLYRRKLEDAERHLLMVSYHSVHGNVSELSRLLGLDRSNLHKKLVKYKIHQSRP